MQEYQKRAIENEIAAFIPRREVIAILGPRQAGKTTLVQRMAKDIEEKGKQVKYLTFENINDRALFEDTIEGFKQYVSGADVVVIDEFQYAKEGGQKLKYLYDTTDTKFIITGSSSLELTFQTGKYMVGRMVTFNLWPFSFSEFLLAKDTGAAALLTNPDIFAESVGNKLVSYFEEYVIWGGYPAVILADGQSAKEKLLSSLYNNYLLRDIKDLLALAKDEELITIIRYLSAQIGNLVNYKSLSGVSGLSYRSIQANLSILRQTYILDLIKPFSRHALTELKKTPKVYFEDLGFRNITLHDLRPFNARPDIGALVENFIYVHLNRKSGQLNKVKYWRTKSGAEVDFIWQDEDGIMPIEVKYDNSDNIGKSLMSFLKKYAPKKAIIFTKFLRKTRQVGETTVEFIPVYYVDTAV